MTTAATLIASKDEAISFEDGPVEVLKHCPYHHQIDFYRAARDTFFENEGLVDMQEFMIRDDIIGRSKAVAIEELIYREDMKMLMAGGYKLFNALVQYYDLYTTIYGSVNLTTEYERLTSINPMQFAMGAYMAFTQANTLWTQEKYAEAGKAFANGVFP